MLSTTKDFTQIVNPISDKVMSGEQLYGAISINRTNAVNLMTDVGAAEYLIPDVSFNPKVDNGPLMDDAEIDSSTSYGSPDDNNVQFRSPFNENNELLTFGDLFDYLVDVNSDPDIQKKFKDADFYKIIWPKSNVPVSMDTISKWNNAGVYAGEFEDLSESDNINLIYKYKETDMAKVTSTKSIAQTPGPGSIKFYLSFYKYSIDDNNTPNKARNGIYDATLMTYEKNGADASIYEYTISPISINQRDTYDAADNKTMNIRINDIDNPALKAEFKYGLGRYVGENRYNNICNYYNRVYQVDNPSPWDVYDSSYNYIDKHVMPVVDYNSQTGQPNKSAANIYMNIRSHVKEKGIPMDITSSSFSNTYRFRISAHYDTADDLSTFNVETISTDPSAVMDGDPAEILWAVDNDVSTNAYQTIYIMPKNNNISGYTVPIVLTIEQLSGNSVVNRITQTMFQRPVEYTITVQVASDFCTVDNLQIGITDEWNHMNNDSCGCSVTNNTLIKATLNIGPEFLTYSAFTNNRANMAEGCDTHIHVLLCSAIDQPIGPVRKAYQEDNRVMARISYPSTPAEIRPDNFLRENSIKTNSGGTQTVSSGIITDHATVSDKLKYFNKAFIDYSKYNDGQHLFTLAYSYAYAGRVDEYGNTSLWPAAKIYDRRVQICIEWLIISPAEGTIIGIGNRFAGTSTTESGGASNYYSTGSSGGGYGPAVEVDVDWV